MTIKQIKSDWKALDVDHRKFVLRVRDGNGGKHAADPHYAGEDYIALWIKSEESGFIKCVGAYKWIVTDKFRYLEKHLFNVE